MTTRRKPIKRTTIGVAAISWGSMAPGMSAKSYTNITSANDKIRVEIIGKKITA